MNYIDGHLIAVYHHKTSIQAFVYKPPQSCFTLVVKIRTDLQCKLNVFAQRT